VQFEYDLAKSQSNKLKHEIDFEEAQQLWNDVFRIEIESRLTAESRFIVIGKLQSKHWSAIVTYRGNVVRIISVRRSRKTEIELYER
jgi:uncharacterized protein